MTVKNAIEVLKSECYVFNPLNLDRTTLINTALDTVIKTLEQKDEVLDKLLKILVESESDIPCDYLNGSNYCCETCNYDNPVKERWIKWAEAEVRAESEVNNADSN